jgi:hypothetical protein
MNLKLGKPSLITLQRHCRVKAGTHCCLQAKKNTKRRMTYCQGSWKKTTASAVVERNLLTGAVNKESLYSRALTSSEVASLYAGGSAGKERIE